jgi:hypothetical protein
MRFRKDIFAFAMAMCAVVALGQTAPPGLWMYTDDFGQPLYSGVELVDTSSKGPPYTAYFGLAKDSITELRDIALDPDTTIVYYFSFPYQFTKGFAECKMIWEDRDWNWDATGYDSLVIKYIGPLQTHKVDIFFGEAIDRYSPAFIDSIGTLPENYFATYKTSNWKTKALALPKAPAGADRTNIREVRFIIHNATGTTSLTSAVGYLDIDIVGLVSKNGTKVLRPDKSRSLTNNHLFFSPMTSGPVELSAFSLTGKLLADRRVPVLAGDQYSVKQFSSSNLKLSMNQLYVVRISGAGINVQETLR